MKKLLKYIILILILFSALSAENKHSDFNSVDDYYKNYYHNRPKKKGNGLKPYKRWSDFWNERINTNDTINLKVISQNAVRSINNFPQYPFKNWEENGPFTTPYNTLSIPSSGIGRVSCIAINPKNFNHILLGAACGGLWESFNGGIGWDPVGFTQIMSVGISDIAFSYSDTNVIYAVTGDVNGVGLSHNYSLGIIKSEDGGKNWDFTNDSIDYADNTVFSKIYVSRTDANKVILGSNKGLCFSDNGGKSINNRVLQGYYIRDLYVNPSDENVIVISAMKDNNYYIIKSNDQGKIIKTVLSLPSSSRIAITASKLDNKLFAVASSKADGGFLGFYTSYDNGDTWQQQSEMPNILGGDAKGTDAGGQGHYDLCIESSLYDSNTVYVGGINLWKSNNSGRSWNCITHWAAQDSLQYVHADHHCIKFSSIGRLFDCNDGGIYVSKDTGNTWNDISSGLSINQIYRFDVLKEDIKKVVAGTQDNGTLISNDINWQHIFGGDGMQCKFYTASPRFVLFSLNNGDIYKSADFGIKGRIVLSEKITGEYSRWITEFTVNPLNENSIYAVYENIWKSEKYAEAGSFNKISNFDDKKLIDKILINPKDTNNILISKGKVLLSSANNAKNWDTINIFSNNISSFAIDTADNQRIYISLSGFKGNDKVYICNLTKANTGYNIQNISYNLPNIPINTIAVDERINQSIVYIGTDLGVFWLNPIKSKWECYGNKLPAVIVNQLQIHSQSNKLVAGTFGRGLWKCDLVNFINSIENCPIQKQNICEGDSLFIRIPGDKVIYWNDDLTARERYLKNSGKYIAYSVDNSGNIEIHKIIEITADKRPDKPKVTVSNQKLSLNTEYPAEYVISWYCDDSLLAIGTKTIEILKSGNYYAKINNSEGCYSVSDTIYAKSGIEIRYDELKAVYIINKKDHFKFKYPNTDIQNISVYNMLGLKLDCGYTIINDEIIIHTECFAVGVYYIKINNNTLIKLMVI